MSIRIATSVTAGLLLIAGTAFAQSKPPVAQFWMDVATNSMSIPGMEDADTGAGGMFGGSSAAPKWVADRQVSGWIRRSTRVTSGPVLRVPMPFHPACGWETACL